MRFKIAVLPGDGIGPEVIAEAVKVLEVVGRCFGHEFSFNYGLIGAVAIDKTGSALPPESLELCLGSDAVLLGAVGHPRYNDPTLPVRPEDGLLLLRKSLGVFANIRPVKVFPALADASTVKAEIVRGVDLVFVRELTGGLYFGRPKKRWSTARGRRAVDTLKYTQSEVERTAKVGFELARARRGHLVSVDKANVLESSRLWRQVVNEVAASYPEVQVEHMLVDTCAMRLVQRPAYFDVLITENMFGDILTDEASVLVGSMGLLPSASLRGLSGFGNGPSLYEPVHGSAPDIAGQGIANPLAAILSIALLLRYSFGLNEAANAVEVAVESVLEQGYRTKDIALGGKDYVGTLEMGRLVALEIEKGRVL